MLTPLHLVKLDFDALMAQAEADEDRYFDLCPGCDEQHMLCPVCGFCLKYCHDDYEHADLFDPMWDVSLLPDEG